ncbi:hypothetical protein F4167_11535 [Candidatus Poribacteria bacterium]|nr:hypothetical protein [Candidatus Poribacteria bacterium]
MLKRCKPLSEVKIAGLLCLLIVVCGTVSFSSLQSETDAESPLAEAEKLILSEKYYEAILALEPLLMNKEKSKSQEEALWLEHQIGEKVAEKIREVSFGIGDPQTKQETSAEKIRTLNKVGAGFSNSPFDTAYYYYDEAFLQQLIQRYPESPKRAVAEYYLIFDGLSFPRQQNLSQTLSVLHAYIEKYEKTGRAEVYKAYLDIAHIHHGLWAVMTFDNPGTEMASWLEDDTKSAETHKAEAEKYYLKYHLNPHGLPEPEDKGYERLKNGEEFGWDYIIYGC